MVDTECRCRETGENVGTPLKADSIPVLGPCGLDTSPALRSSRVERRIHIDEIRYPVRKIPKHVEVSPRAIWFTNLLLAGDPYGPFMGNGWHPATVVAPMVPPRVATDVTYGSHLRRWRGGTAQLFCGASDPRRGNRRGFTRRSRMTASEQRADTGAR